jgi:glycine betaine/proline transport system ATP-binding protein
LALIEVRNVSTVFGPSPRKALALVRGGMGKDELLAETGAVLALDDVSLTVERSETFVVMGLSGSGKSTLIRHLNRLIDPTEGAILIDGVDILGLSVRALEQFRRGRLAMVFQRFGLFPHRTILDNVAYGLEVRGIAKAERHARAAEWVSAVGLAGYEARYPAALSGGMQQRVGLARALCSDAEILLMDEAFSALDPLIRAEMQDQLAELQARLRKTIVFITHDLDEALRLGDRIAILKDGRIAQVGPPSEIVGNPSDDYVRSFVRAVSRRRTVEATGPSGTPGVAEGGPTPSP